MRTRYEIEVTRLKDGRLYLRAFDEYWDGSRPRSLTQLPNRRRSRATPR